MSNTNTQRVAYGYGQESRIFREISEGNHPRCSNKIAPYLPVQEIKYQGGQAFPVVIKAGQLIALDQWNQFVLANCGATNTLTYGANDVTWSTPMYSASAALGAGSVATSGATATQPANKLVGYAFFDFVANTSNSGYLNYQVQTDHKTVSTNMLVEYPIINATQAAVTQGDIILPDNANPGYWRPAVAGDFASVATIKIAMENNFGKCYKVGKIVDGLDGMDRIQGAPGLNLFGTIDSPAGAGLPSHFLGATTQTHASNTAAGNESSKWRVLINVNV